MNIQTIESYLEIPLGLLYALITVETGHRNVMVPHDGKSASYGVAQIKLATARGIQVDITAKELMNPTTNALIAGKYLKGHFKRYKNWEKALCRYNTGKPLSTCSYSQKVLAAYGRYRTEVK